jgi:hypothetical protein
MPVAPDCVEDVVAHERLARRLCWQDENIEGLRFKRGLDAGDMHAPPYEINFDRVNDRYRDFSLSMSACSGAVKCAMEYAFNKSRHGMATGAEIANRHPHACARTRCRAKRLANNAAATSLSIPNNSQRFLRSDIKPFRGTACRFTQRMRSTTLMRFRKGMRDVQFDSIAAIAGWAAVSARKPRPWLGLRIARKSILVRTTSDSG